MMRPTAPLALFPVLLVTMLAACGGGETGMADCIDPDAPDAAGQARREGLELCPATAGGGAARADRGGGSSCPAADVAAWRVTIRYAGELGGTSANGYRRATHDVTAELNAVLPMTRRANASGEDWAPSGRVAHRMQEFDRDALILTAVGEGAPSPGNSATISGSRILLSINAHDCTYNLYSTGVVPSQVTRGGQTTTADAGYGTVIIRNQPASLSIAGAAALPVLEDTGDPRDEMPELYIPSIGRGDSVQVSWQIEPN